MQPRKTKPGLCTGVIRLLSWQHKSPYALLTQLGWHWALGREAAGCLEAGTDPSIETVVVLVLRVERVIAISVSSHFFCSRGTASATPWPIIVPL